MASARRRRRPSGGYYKEWEGWYYDRYGKRRWFKGFRTRRETLEVAVSLEQKERRARLLGLSNEVDHSGLYSDVVEQYLAWGEAQGGRGGQGWSDVHLRTRKHQLRELGKGLSLESIQDLYTILPRFEGFLRALALKGLSPKTVSTYGQSMQAFCSWAKDRGFLERHPLESWTPVSSKPQRTRRALTQEQFVNLVHSSHPKRRLTYMVAVFTGYRARELRALRVRDWDSSQQTLDLSGEFTKNRKRAVQPIPRTLAKLLDASIEGKRQDDMLLYVPTHTARDLDIDLAAAGIEKCNSEGVVDFHALRVTFATWLAESGVHAGELRHLVRHSTVELTFGRYVTMRNERIAAKVDQIARGVLDDDSVSNS